MNDIITFSSRKVCKYHRGNERPQRGGTDNTIGKQKVTQRQTMVDEKLKIEQHKPC